MSTNSFRDFVLKQLDSRSYFKANPDTLPDHPPFYAAVFAALEKQVLMDFRGFSSDILKDVVQLTTWARKVVRP